MIGIDYRISILDGKRLLYRVRTGNFERANLKIFQTYSEAKNVCNTVMERKFCELS